MPLWSNPTCQNALRDQFGPAYSLPNTALCAGAEGRDACDVSISACWGEGDLLVGGRTCLLGEDHPLQEDLLTGGSPLTGGSTLTG